MSNWHLSSSMVPKSTDPKRVAIVYRMDHPGGVQSCVYALIKGLNERGIIPDILWDIQPDWAYLRKHNLQAGYRAIFFPFPTNWITRLPYTLRYFAWIANGYNGDALSYRYDFFYVFYNGFFLSGDVPHVRYLSGPPLIPELKRSSAGLRGVPYRFFQWTYQHLLKDLSPVYELHQSSRYIINSEYTANLFEHTHHIRLPVVTPPIDLSGREFSPYDWDQRDTLTFFSRFVDYKRPEMVLELAKRYPKMRCLLMGSVPVNRRAYYESLKRKAAQNGIHNTIFLANPSTERVKAELARTCFYIFPAKNEHFGMTTPEAIASGAIPFVHDSGGQIEIVNDERLRFQDNSFIEKFAYLISFPVELLEDIRRSLIEHIQIYAEEIFIAKMLFYLDAVPTRGNIQELLAANSHLPKSNGKTKYRILEK